LASAGFVFVHEEVRVQSATSARAAFDGLRLATLSFQDHNFSSPQQAEAKAEALGIAPFG
jgi:hypothetical protein